MKLHILLDLHLEMGEYTPAVPAADLVILVGDIHKGGQAVRWASREYPQLPVLLVPGNNEYYGSTVQAIQNEMQEAALGTNVVILDDYALGPTRIISNQRGYPREAAPGFDPELVIEI